MNKKWFLFSILFLFSASIHAQIPTDGLAGYWPFNGNANDESGNGFHLEIIGSPELKTYRFNKLEQSFLLDGENDFFYRAKTDSLLPAKAFTICAWVNNPGVDSYEDVIVSTLDVPDQYGYQLALQSRETPPNRIIGIIRCDGISYFVFTPYESTHTNRWVFVVFTYSASENKIALYVDGEFMSETTDIEQITYHETSNFRIGTNPHEENASRRFKGSIDDVRIYNRVLSQAEINALYHEPGPCYETIYDTIRVAVTDTLIIEIPSIVHEAQIINTLKVYPNPTRDILFIYSADYIGISDYSIKIINTTGTTVFESKINSPLFDIDLNQFGSKGLYFIQIINEDGHITDIRKILLK